MIFPLLLILHSFFLPSQQDVNTDLCRPGLDKDTYWNPLHQHLEVCLINRQDPFPMKIGDKIKVKIEVLDLKLLEHSLLTNEKRFRVSVKYTWNNEFLSWDKLVYKTDAIYRRANLRMWYPRMKLHLLQKTTIFNGMIKLNSNGVHEMYQNHDVSINCDIKYHNFPNDDHRCLFQFVFERRTLTDVEYYFSNYTTTASKLKEWTFKIEQAASNELFSFKSNNPTHSTMWFFFLEMNRSSTLYTSLLTIPSLFLSIFILLSFLVPAKNNQRFALNLFLFLCILIQFQSLQNALPIYMNDVPIIAKYLLLLMLLLYVSISTSVMTTLLRKQTAFNAIPTFIKTIFSSSILQRILFVRHHSDALLQPSIPHTTNPRMKKMLLMLDEYIFLKTRESGESDKVINNDFKFVALSIERIVFTLASMVAIVASAVTASKII